MYHSVWHFPYFIGKKGMSSHVSHKERMILCECSNSSEHITYPNFVLINKPIANIHRSPDQWDAIEFQILASTSLQKLSILRYRIDKYVQGLPQIWYPRWRLIVRDIEDTNKLRLLMTIQHHINFQVCPTVNCTRIFTWTESTNVQLKIIWGHSAEYCSPFLESWFRIKLLYSFQQGLQSHFLLSRTSLRLHDCKVQDAGERTQRRSDMLLHIQGLLLDLTIGYQFPQSQILVHNLLLSNPSQPVVRAKEPTR